MAYRWHLQSFIRLLHVHVEDNLGIKKQGNTGKPNGNDFKEKKITLPLIYSLSQVGEDERRWALRTVKNHGKNPSKVNDLIRFVEKNGGIDYARKKMTEQMQKALQILSEFPDSDAKSALFRLVEFTAQRKR